MAELPQVTEVQRLRLEPGDKLVIRADVDRMSHEDADMLQCRVRAALRVPDDFPVMVLPAGWSAEVLNSGAPAAAEGQAPGVPA